MKKLNIVADNKIPFLQGVLEPWAKVRYLKGSEIDRADLKGADALLIRTRTKCDELLLKDTPVKFIATATIGYDHIDTDYCRDNNIVWKNAPGCNSSSVEQYIVATLLHLAVSNNIDLQDKTMAVVGVGNVGKKISHVAKALGMRVLLNDPPRQRIESSYLFCDIEQIQREADFISFHVPLNMDGQDKTFHMVDSNFFDKLAKKPFLINSSRGSVIDQVALLKALDNDLLAGAILDVWENEPEINLELLNKVFMASPHVAGYSTDGKARGTSMSVQALSEFFNLDLNSWEPEKLPFPGSESIVVDCFGMSKWEILHEVFSRTYDIAQEDAQFRAKPELFEYFRGNYPVRREAHNFYVRLNSNPFEEVEVILTELGFSLLELDCFC
jgi:erythronate-4-phosphate dehydrogenase